MTLVDTTGKEQGDSVSFEFDLRHVPQKVWRALTDPVLLAEWLLPVADFALEKGRVFSFRRPPIGGWDGIVNCCMLEIEEHRKLSYVWRAGDFVDTVLTFTLTPTAAGTRLSLVQSGFKQKQNAGGARYGWKLMGTKLIELLDRVP
jgi:uncharacterized protein YndB with AHSA1/START domain